MGRGNVAGDWVVSSWQQGSCCTGRPSRRHKLLQSLARDVRETRSCLTVGCPFLTSGLTCRDWQGSRRERKRKHWSCNARASVSMLSDTRLFRKPGHPSLVLSMCIIIFPWSVYHSLVQSTNTRHSGAPGHVRQQSSPEQS
jgi:hypothetical protein